MRNLLLIMATLSLVIILDTNLYGGTSIPSNHAPLHIGEYVTVCGTVAQVAKLKKRTVLNIGASYPNEDIYFLIWDSDISQFNAKFGNLNKLVNRNMCATGKIEVYKNHLEIILKHPSNLN